MNIWWIILVIGFINMAEGNFAIAALIGLLCLIFGEFE